MFIYSIWLVLGFAVFQTASLDKIKQPHVQQPQIDYVDREISAALKKFPNLKLISIKNQTGKIKLKKSSGLTVEDLRGVSLDEKPPKLARLVSYNRRDSDRLPRGTSPYVAQGINPFRLNQFNCELNYGGRHNYPMQDYASLHGFNIINPDRRTRNQIANFPAGTRISKWKGIELYRPKWFREKGIPDTRYDLLENVDFQNRQSLGDPRANQLIDNLMLDMEHPVYDREKLAKQKWYPRHNSRQFETRYYTGYAKTLTSTIASHRLAGFKQIGIYGWQPLERSWVPMLLNKPLPRDGWEMYGKQVYENVDLIHNSVYCPYLDSKNVAFVLAMVEENVKRVNEMPVKKPVRPYFWPLISGGGGGFRWWRELPHPNEDQLGMIAMSFFTGIDGVVVWNWSGISNHHEPSVLSFNEKQNKNYRAVMVGNPFRMSKADGSMETFQRYDALHVQNLESDVLSFQKIRPNEKESNYGVSPNRELFHANFAGIKPYLRSRSEPISAIVEALALIKPFEYSLKTGQPRSDFDALSDFRRSKPLLRRVENGKYHLVITYNPNTIRTGVGGEIDVKDFAGQRGLNLVFPADEHTRIYVVGDF